MRTTCMRWCRWVKSRADADDSPRRVLADTSFHSKQNVAQLTARGIDVYVAHANLASELHHGPPLGTSLGRMTASNPHLLAERQKLRTPQGQRHYRQRQTIVERVCGVLKEQPGMRKVQARSLEKVNVGHLYAHVS
jgi:Transposase DDE domain